MTILKPVLPNSDRDRMKRHLMEYVHGVLMHPIPISEFGSNPWFMPYYKPLRNHYYNILYNIARVCKVKLMWKWLLEHDTLKPHKGVLVIGELSRVQSFIHIANYVFGSIIPANSKYSSQSIISQLDNICKDIEKLLESDKKYDLWLENKIKFLYRLDYKNYKGVPVYYHAISKRFHPNRMLL